jgi:ppGpp synthetase/RelA/SpoT-type nucleotidyltranferase
MINEAEIRDSYDKRKESLQALGEWVIEIITLRLRDQLGSVSDVERFFQIPPKVRVKHTDSFLEKALIRKKKKNPLEEITDQVGVRFVVLLLEDIAKIGKIIENYTGWNHRKDRDHEQERMEKPDYFAYQSDHYIVTTQAPLVYEDVNIPAKFSCEIQIRTILQHAYAEMAHCTDYKPSISLSEADQKKVRRSLAKGSALIETTDDVFKEIKEKIREYDENIDKLLCESEKAYNEITGFSSLGRTPLSILITDTYRSLLKPLKVEDFRMWLTSHTWLASRIKEKLNESVFYRDAIILIIAWLIKNNETAVPSQWPIDSTYLEDIYTMMGISKEGIF